MSLNRIKKQMIDPEFVKQVDDNTAELAQTEIDLNGRGINVVAQFGLIGDGETDNALAIRKLNEYLLLQSECNLFFPPGHYKTSIGIDISTCRSVSLIGDHAFLELIGEDFSVLPYDYHLFYIKDVSHFYMKGLSTKITIKNKEIPAETLRSYHVWIRAINVPLENCLIEGNVFNDGMGHPITNKKSYYGTLWIDGDAGVEGLYGKSGLSEYINKNITICNNIFNNSCGRVAYVLSAENVHVYGNKFNNQAALEPNRYTKGGNTVSLRLLGVKKSTVHNNDFIGTDYSYYGSIVSDYYNSIVLAAGATNNGVPTVDCDIHDNNFIPNNTQVRCIDAYLCSNVRIKNNYVEFSDFNHSVESMFVTGALGSLNGAYTKDVIIENNTIVNFTEYTIRLANPTTTDFRNIVVVNNIFDKGDLSPENPFSVYSIHYDEVIFVLKNIMLNKGIFEKYIIKKGRLAPTNTEKIRFKGVITSQSSTLYIKQQDLSNVLYYLVPRKSVLSKLTVFFDDKINSGTIDIRLLKNSTKLISTSIYPDRFERYVETNAEQGYIIDPTLEVLEKGDTLNVVVISKDLSPIPNNIVIEVELSY